MKTYNTTIKFHYKFQTIFLAFTMVNAPPLLTTYTYVHNQIMSILEYTYTRQSTFFNLSNDGIILNYSESIPNQSPIQIEIDRGNLFVFHEELEFP